MAASLKDLYDELRVSQGPQRGRADSTQDDPFILKLTELVFSCGIQANASDIHIEPTALGAQVRYRIDGMLQEVLKVPPEISGPLIRAIKVKANLINEAVGHSRPQDSRFDFRWNDRTLDLRLSAFPTLFGDVLALRVLDRSASVLSLKKIGFPPAVLKEFERLIRQPNGMILVTGPAGSGKTTTLYAALNALRSPRTKIVTLEDPVEYQIEGIDQSQINLAIGLTFASGLRAILRQDANIILVGEIRDKDTADIAIRAALTGHLVLSTLHTRNALGAAIRLVDMGIEPHLIISAITAILGQRLVRLLCRHCKVPDPLAAKSFTELWSRETRSPPPPTIDFGAISKHVGCPTCQGTGYQGRVAIFELLLLTDEVKEFILDGSLGRFSKAPATPMRTMLFNGLERVAQGVTTIDEVLRVADGREDT